MLARAWPDDRVASWEEIVFADDCEMAYGEQAAMTGVLASLKPRLALEIGTYTGGSLALIAPHAAEVHTFDLAKHVNGQPLPNVTYHLGDSKSLVPDVLAGFEDAGRNVDFILIDGDHAREGVAADLANVLASPAVSRTVILLHDVANEDVRAGVRDAGLDRDKVAYVNLSFVPPWERNSPLAETWGGLGLVVVDQGGALWRSRRRHDANVAWPTAVPRTWLWHAASPVRYAKRRVAYRVRPALRALVGTRGENLERSGPA